MKTSYIWIDGVMCEKKDVRISPKSAAIMEDIKPFVSPITREVITSRPALRAHNKRHGVTNTADYSHEFLAKRSKERLDGQATAGKADRINLIKQAMEKL